MRYEPLVEKSIYNKPYFSLEKSANHFLATTRISDLLAQQFLKFPWPARVAGYIIGEIFAKHLKLEFFIYELDALNRSQ